MMFFMLLSGKPEVTLISFIIASVMLLISGLYITVIQYTIIFAALFIYCLVITYSDNSFFHGFLFSMIGIIAFITQRIIPFLMLASIIKKKNLSEITTALERCKLPKEIILSTTVTLRYFPSIRNDFLTIVDAMKLKGIDTSWRGALFHPLRMLECIIVPMLFRSLKTSEEFSCAALVKGIENQGRRSSYFDVRIKRIDLVFSLTAILLLIASARLDLF